MNTDKTQRCARCKTPKPWSAYSKNRSLASGRQNECKSCNHLRHEDRKRKAVEALESAMAIPMVRV